MSAARRRVALLLKRRGPLSPQAIADELGLTDVAARQHLSGLEAAGLAASEQLPPAGRGRPGTVWQLTEDADALFPDRHGELTVGLIDAIRKTVGEDGLGRIVEVRARDQLNLYREQIPKRGSLRKRVEALADQRTDEGYMAEVVQEKPGVYLLIEHHCPICDAARSCQGFCRGELQVFREVLGPDVEVERTAHVLSGDQRCAYRIKRRA